jgi:K+-sensing histidine kinase KdpD
VNNTFEGGVTIEISYDKDDSMMKFRVEDTGSGIALQDQAEIFKMFDSLSLRKDSFIKSAGLGLMISKMIVNKFGGTLSFVSQQKHGSLFTFDFYIEESDNQVAVYDTEASTRL